MAGDTANPRVWVGADVYVAPIGTTAPTDVATALNVAFLPLGLLSQDGMTESRDETIDDKYAWGNILVRTVRSKHKRSFQVTALEDNKTVWALLNPGSTAATSTGITTRTIKAPTPNPQAFVFHLVDGTNIKRIVVPRGEIFDVGDKTISDDELAAVQFTINVYPASDGTIYKEITNDSQAVVP